jgi:Calcineurin-like phosphoesterase
MNEKCEKAMQVLRERLGPRVFAKQTLIKLAFEEAWNVLDMESERQVLEQSHKVERLCQLRHLAASKKERRSIARVLKGTSGVDDSERQSLRISSASPKVNKKLRETSAVESSVYERVGSVEIVRGPRRAEFVRFSADAEIGSVGSLDELKSNFSRGRVLSIDDSLAILDATVALYESRAADECERRSCAWRTVVDVQVPDAADGDDAKLTVCGDLHGQLADLLTILRLNGEPRDNHNVYIFNGDFVDRGRHGVEVALLLFAFKLARPNSIFLNRGNRMLQKSSSSDEAN